MKKHGPSHRRNSSLGLDTSYSSRFHPFPDKLDQPEKRHYEEDTGSEKTHNRSKSFPGLHGVGEGASRPQYSDRYIPCRSSSNLEHGMIPPPTMEIGPRDAGEPGNHTEGSTYSLLLRNEILGESSVGRALAMTQQATGRAPMHNSDVSLDAGMSDVVSTYDATATESHDVIQSRSRTFRFMHGRSASSSMAPGSCLYNNGSPADLCEESRRLLANGPKRSRKIAKAPYKVLDAPDLQDDFYLNLMDWSSQNVLAVGLAQKVYLWSACTSKVTLLCDLSDDMSSDKITSVSWAQRGCHLAVGTKNGDVQIWDSVRATKLRTMGAHTGRVGSLAWNGNFLASGGRDRSIFLRDVRASDDYMGKLDGHKQEVCGLKWSYNGMQLASGGNDNKLLLWNAAYLGTRTTPVQELKEHKAAVKALSWSPHQHGLLASGGGTADRRIRFWNTLTGNCVDCVDTGSQVCNLTWSKNVNEIVSTHGYSLNQIIVWKYPSMKKITTLTGHTFRVLYLAISPDGQNIVTGAGDETLRFWNVFPPSTTKDGSSIAGEAFARLSSIR